MSDLTAKPSDTYPRVIVRVRNTGGLVGSLSPMEAYRLADELTNAADKLLSEQPGKFSTGPQAE